MKKTSAILTALLLAATGLPASAEGPEISVDVADQNGLRASQVYEGQPARLVIAVKNADDVSEPDLSDFDDFDVALAGKEPLGVRTIIVNGRTVEKTRGGVQFVYRLTPRKVGLLKIPAVTVEADGQTLQSPEKTLRVRPADEQDAVFMEIVSDRPSTYPMEPFTVTLTVQVKALPGKAAAESPLGVQAEPPVLTIPWATDENLPDGLVPAIGWQRWLGPMQTRSGQGFSINNLGRGSLYSLFGSQPLTFEPRVRRVTRPDASGQETDYWEYEFARVFVARKVGPLKFGPVTLSGFFYVRTADDGRHLVGESTYAVARPITVDVKDAPLEGRPASYTGAIGQFTLSGSLKPDRVKVGDPMTLTLTLKGKGTLGSTFAPDLEQVPEIASRFKVYEATEETSGDTSQFTYALRPLEEGIDRFPPVALTYFDVDTEKFVTLKTDPVPIAVSAADVLSSDEVVAAPGAARSRHELQARGEGIFANLTDVGLVRNEGVRPGRWLSGLVGLVGLYFVVAMVGVRIRQLAGDRALVRRRAAASAARRRLREARAAFQSGERSQGSRLVEASLVHLAADAADVPAEGLTPKDVRDRLRSLGVEDELVERVGRFLDACDAGRYGAPTAGDREMLEEAETLVGETIHSLKRKKRLR